jgi:hypothetical protein
MSLLKHEMTMKKTTLLSIVVVLHLAVGVAAHVQK